MGSTPACGAVGSITENIAELAPQQVAVFEYPFTFPGTLTSFTARAFVDSQCVVTETNEGNNQNTRGYVVSGADLTVLDMTVTPAAALPGTEAVMTVTVKNLGSLAANNFRVDSWFDRSASPSCGNLGSVTENIETLAPNATTVFTYPFVFPATLGVRAARAFADAGCVVTENNENNNQFSRNYTVMAPDLTVVNVSITPTSGPPGTAATMTVTIRNIGSLVAENFNVGSWFDFGSTPVCGNTASVTDNVETLAPGAMATFTYSFTYPVLFGTRTARAFVDNTCAVAEMNEGNNQYTRNYTVTGPDLTIVGMTVTPATGEAGSNATLTLVIGNTGAEMAPAFNLDAWLALGITLNCGTVGNITKIVPSLAAGASQTFNIPFVRPTTVGTLTARAFVDSQCAVAETNEGNNQASRTYGVTAQSGGAVSSGLEVSMALNKLYYTPGEAGVVYVTVMNRGATIGNYTVDVYRSTTSTAPYQRVTRPTLAAGATDTFAVSFVNFVAMGTYTFKVVIGDAVTSQEYIVTLPAPPLDNSGSPTTP